MHSFVLNLQEERLRAEYAHDEDKLFKQSSVTNKTAQFSDTNYVPMQNITYVGSKDQEDEVIANDGSKIEREEQSKLEKVEAGLARARAAIREATRSCNRTSPLYDQDYVPKDFFLSFLPFCFSDSVFIFVSVSIIVFIFILLRPASLFV